MGGREQEIYEHAVRAVIAQAAKDIERLRRQRDIYEHAVHAVISQAAEETASGSDSPYPCLSGSSSPGGCCHEST